MSSKRRIWQGVGVVLVAGGLLVAAAPAAMTAPSPRAVLSAPSNLHAVSVTDVDIVLAWDASKDSDRRSSVTYDLFFDDNPTPFGPLGDTRFDLQLNQAIGMVPGSVHKFRVQAQDSSGHVSPFSNTLVASFAPGDNNPPTTPTNLRVLSQSAAGIRLGWDPSTDESDFTYRVIGLVGCPVLVVPSDATQVLEPSVDSDPVCGLSPGSTYSFQVFARDAFDNDSQLSNEVTVTFSPA